MGFAWGHILSFFLVAGMAFANPDAQKSCAQKYPALTEDPLTDDLKAFDTDIYGGKAYERGVMGYGDPVKGGGWWGVQLRSQEIVREELIRLEAAGRQRVEILDIGSGPGFTLDRMKHVASDCCTMEVRAQGLEYNDKMVDYSRERYGVMVRQGDMHKIAGMYRHRHFDIIHAQSVLWISPKPWEVVGQISEVQKPGGIVTFTWMVHRDNHNGYDNYVSWFSAFSKSLDVAVAQGRMTAEEAANAKEANSKLVLGNNLTSPRDPDEIRSLLQVNGYKLEAQYPQYLDEHGQPFFFQYVFRKKP